MRITLILRTNIYLLSTIEKLEDAQVHNRIIENARDLKLLKKVKVKESPHNNRKKTKESTGTKVKTLFLDT